MHVDDTVDTDINYRMTRQLQVPGALSVHSAAPFRHLSEANVTGVHSLFSAAIELHPNNVWLIRN